MMEWIRTTPSVSRIINFLPAGITRLMNDDFALQSQQRYAAAAADGRFTAELTPVVGLKVLALIYTLLFFWTLIVILKIQNIFCFIQSLLLLFKFFFDSIDT